MESNRLIDTQFDRAVEIVQSLPKNGAIQTGYEEKLSLYSLYKQATSGNVTQSRPGMWDMLGRAKWDAWAKQKDLSPPEAKWLYVDTLQRILQKYSEDDLANELLRELSSYSGDPSNLVMSGSLNPSSRRDDRSSLESDDESMNPPMPPYPGELQISRQQPHRPPADESSEEEPDSDVGEEVQQMDPTQRPPSGVSRYRTPMGVGPSDLVPARWTPPVDRPYPSQNQNIAQVQPMPRYATPTAFSPPMETRHSASPGFTPNPYDQPSTSTHPYTHHQPPQQLIHSHQSYGHRAAPQLGPNRSGSNSSGRAAPIERALESLQVTVAALSERLQQAEAQGFGGSNTSLARQGGAGGLSTSGRGSPNGGTGTNEVKWTPEQMGLWSVVLVPATRAANRLKGWVVFILNEPPIPAYTSGKNGRGRRANGAGGLDLSRIVRRFVLDASFVFAVFITARQTWKATGLKRRQLIFIMKLFWIMLFGRPKRKRQLVDRGVATTTPVVAAAAVGTS